ncbi:MAG: CRISPR-associated protein Csx11 [Promethearchaeota archaeon]
MTDRNMLAFLESKRDTILKAEIGALLHDIGKARAKFIEDFSSSRVHHNDDHNQITNLLPHNVKSFLQRESIDIDGNSVTLLDIVEKHHKEQANGTSLTNPQVPEIIRLLYAAWNGYDGLDSGLDKKNAEKKQDLSSTAISTVFGFEKDSNDITHFQDVSSALFDDLNSLLDNNNNISITEIRNQVLIKLRSFYLQFLGETRRPANDVTLWDHSYSVATMFKCAIVKNLLDVHGGEAPKFRSFDFNWKILAVNVDILTLLSKGIKVGDILRYYQEIKEALHACKELIEVEYPLGNEIYRDSTGIYFLIADVDLEPIKSLLNTILNPELMASIISREAAPIDQSKQDREKERELREGLVALFKEIRMQSRKEISFPTSSERFNRISFETKRDHGDICPVCQLRLKPLKSESCEKCETGRIRTAKGWIDNGSEGTIWIDEISDQNNQVAAVVGAFNLEKWHDGSYIENLVMNKSKLTRYYGLDQGGKEDENNQFRKNASPGRVRRCWETTRDFIHNAVISKVLKEHAYFPLASNEASTRLQRVAFKLVPNPNIPKSTAVDMEIDGRIISPVSIGEQRGLFLTTHNLQMTSTWGKTRQEMIVHLNGKVVRLKSTDGKNWLPNHYEIQDIQNPEGPLSKYSQYSPYMTIFNSPDQFLVLVPAIDALNIAETMLKEYTVHFSKVRDRLPFHLCVIGFHRKTPLNLVLDASRNWLDVIYSKQNENSKQNKKRSIEARVEEISNNGTTGTSDHYKMKLECFKYSPVPVSWDVSIATGDPSEKDWWYPYYRVKDPKPSGQGRWFECTVPGYHCRHVSEIKKGDHVLIDPSYFSLAYLERASDRWNMEEKVMSLHGLERIQQLWNAISTKSPEKKWSKTQLQAYWQESIKWKESLDDQDVYEKIIESMMKNMLKISRDGEKELFNTIFQATIDGLLDLCLFWNFQVCKFKLFGNAKERKEQTNIKGGS